MNDQENIIGVKILDRMYNIKCPPSQTQDLQASARFLDEQMRKIRQAGNITNTERVAVVAALNVCNELMQMKKQQNGYIETMHERIQDLQQRISKALAESDPVAV